MDLTSNRARELVGKVVKTLASVRFKINHEEYSDDEIKKYNKAIVTGLVSLFKGDTSRFIRDLSDFKTLKVIIRGETICATIISLAGTMPKVTYSYIDPNKLKPELEGYVHDFMNTVAKDPTYDVVVYAKVIVESYLNISKKIIVEMNKDAETKNGKCHGKIQIY